MPQYDRNASEWQTVALQAINWIVSDPNRAERFLGLTGLEPAELRQGLGEPAMLASALDFLIGHEPDLIAFADAVGERPEVVVAARQEAGL